MKSILQFLLLSFLVHSSGLYAQTKKLFALAGQSNAAGMGNTDPNSPLLSVGGANGTCMEYLFDTDEAVLRNFDPTGENISVGNRIPNYYFIKSQTVSAWPAFAKKYLELWKQRTNVNSSVYLVQTAKGGSGCHPSSFSGTDYSYNTWSQGDLLFFKSVEKINAAIKKTCVPLTGIIWLQGETDAAAIRRNDITKEDYKQALIDLIARYRQTYGSSLKFFIIKTALSYLQKSNCVDPCAYNSANYAFCCPASNTNSGFDQVRQAQEEVAASDPNTFIVYDHPGATSTVVPNSSQLGYYKDGLHYIKTVYDSVGTNVAKKIFQLETTNFKKP